MRSEDSPGRDGPATARSSTVSLGYVSRPNGLRGAVVLHSDPSMHDVVVRGLAVELRPRRGDVLRTRVLGAAPIRGGLRVTFEKVSDRNAAEALVGATVVIERDALGPLEDGVYLDTDLIGLDVVARDGSAIGRLVEVVATGANDVYVARGDDGSEIMIPAVAHAVLDVDLDAGRMTVDAGALEYGAAPPADPGETGARPGRKDT